LGVREGILITDLSKKKLSWEPSMKLEEGLRKTYIWIEELKKVSKNGLEEKIL
jgi:dTDP-D-glucose 4,6-dehydratase